jgi:hypothetical protein
LIKLGLVLQDRQAVIFKKGTYTKSDVNYLRNKLMINGLFLRPFGIVREISPTITVLDKSR